GVFGSETNVFEDFRRQAKTIQKDENPYIIATNERLTRKIPIQTFDFTKWMNENAMTNKPFWSFADEKENEERYKNVHLVIMTEYREDYLQDLERDENRKAEQSTTTEVTEQKDTDIAGQTFTQQDDKEEISEQPHSEAV